MTVAWACVWLDGTCKVLIFRDYGSILQLLNACSGTENEAAVRVLRVLCSCLSSYSDSELSRLTVRDRNRLCSN